jgi:hypothetical protein
LGYVALVGGTTLTLVTGWCFATLVDSILEKVLTTCIVAVAQIVLTLLFAGGVLESFAAGTILAVNAVVTTVSLAIVVRSTSIGDRVRGSWATVRRVRPGGDLLGTAWAWVLGVFVAIEATYIALCAYVLPPATWDSLTYHLVVAAEWINADRIVQSPLSLLANSSPLNGQMTFLWVGALTGSDVLVDLPQLGFAALGACAVVAIARTVGTSRAGAIVAGCLYFLTPVVLAQASVAYVDLVYPGLFLAGYALLLRVLEAHDARTQRPVAMLALAGVACGLAAGSKSIGVIYAGVAVVVLAGWLVWRVRRSAMPARSAVGWFAAFVLPVVAFGSFWYVRTWIEYGNPTYPYQVVLGGVEVFSGRPFDEFINPPPSLADAHGPLRTLKAWTDLGGADGYTPTTGGFGPQWLLLELPALVLFVVHLARFRRRLLLTFVVPFVVMLAATPSSWFSRFTILFVAPGVVALPFVLERIRQRAVVAFLQLATIVVVAVGCVRPADRVTLAGKVFSPDDVLTRAGDSANSRTLGRLVLPAYSWTDEIPSGSRVAVRASEIPTFFAFPWVYQLFGSDFRNDVVALDDREVDADALVRDLRRREADYLVTWSGTPNQAIARERPDVFDPVSSVGGVDVFRVSGAPRSAAPAP